MAERRVSRVLALPQDPREDLPAFCARPSCRREFRRQPGPGRPSLYCCGDCRTSAINEERTIQSRIKHFSSVLDQARADLAAFQREAEMTDPLADRRHLEESVIAAEAALRFVDPANPLAEFLSDLVTAVRSVSDSPRLGRTG